MDFALVTAIVVLGIVCLLWIVLLAFRTIWQAAAAGLVVWGAVHVVGLLGGASAPTSTKLGALAAEVVFLIACVPLERRFRRQWRKRNAIEFERRVQAAIRGPRGDRYRAPD